MTKLRISGKGKLRDIIQEVEVDLFPDKGKSSILESLIERKKSQPEKRELSKNIQRGIELLNSCVKPQESEKIKVVRTQIRFLHNKFSVEYPVVERNREFKLVDIAYLADQFTRTVDGDFSLLMKVPYSKILRRAVFDRLNLEDDNITGYFLEDCANSSNSRNSLAMYLGYKLLLPNKIERVEEIGRGYKRTLFDVYTFDLRGIDSGIYGAGTSILRYLGLRAKINIHYDRF